MDVSVFPPNFYQVCGTEGMITVENHIPALEEPIEDMSLCRLPLASIDGENFVTMVKHFLDVSTGAQFAIYSFFNTCQYLTAHLKLFVN